MVFGETLANTASSRIPICNAARAILHCTGVISISGSPVTISLRSSRQYSSVATTSFVATQLERYARLSALAGDS